MAEISVRMVADKAVELVVFAVGLGRILTATGVELGELRWWAR